MSEINQVDVATGLDLELDLRGLPDELAAEAQARRVRLDARALEVGVELELGRGVAHLGRVEDDRPLRGLGPDGGIRHVDLLRAAGRHHERRRQRDAGRGALGRDAVGLAADVGGVAEVAGEDEAVDRERGGAGVEQVGGLGRGRVGLDGGEVEDRGAHDEARDGVLGGHVEAELGAAVDGRVGADDDRGLGPLTSGHRGRVVLDRERVRELLGPHLDGRGLGGLGHRGHREGARGRALDDDLLDREDAGAGVAHLDARRQIGARRHRSAGNDGALPLTDFDLGDVFASDPALAASTDQTKESHRSRQNQGPQERYLLRRLAWRGYFQETSRKGKE
jgi:hypothetical protein